MSGCGSGNQNRTVETLRQDNVAEVIDLHLSRLLQSVSLRSALVIDQSTVPITVTAGAPIVGQILCLKDTDGVAFYQGEILSVFPVAGNDYDVEIDSPLDFAFDATDGCSLRSQDLAVDGSGTPVEFIVSPFGLVSGTEWDIIRVFMTINGTSAMDDGLFGDLPAITKGILLRTDNGVTKNIFNAKTNGDFELHSGDRKYADRAPAGQTSVSVRRTINGDDKNGTVLRIKTDDSDGVKIIVQDDLTGLVSFFAVAQGHVASEP